MKLDRHPGHREGRRRRPMPAPIVAGLLLALSLVAAPIASAAPSATDEAGYGSSAFHRFDGGGQSELDSYCSQSGDFCLTAFRARGRVKLLISTFSFRGGYALCVRGPDERACRDFRLTKDGDLFSDMVDLERKFGDQGHGRYKVRWKKFGGRLGKPLRFRL